jgi:hypothetical protein
MKIDCLRCGKHFSNLNNFKTHLTGTKNCKAVCISIPLEKYRKQFKLLNTLFLEDYNKSKETNELVYGCEYCNKVFKSRKYYFKHKKHHCSKREVNEILYDINHVMNHTQKNTQHNVNRQNNINDSNINSNNVINNSVVNNNNNIINNNFVNNIIIKNYDDNEDEKILKTIPDDIKKKLLTSPQTAIENIHKLIHIDNPEYRNIYIKDIKEGHGYVYNNGEWDVKIMNELLEELLITNCDRIYDIMNDEDINIKKSYLKILTKLFENVSDNGNIAKNIKRKIKLMTHCYKNTIKNTYENNSKKKLKLLIR